MLNLFARPVPAPSVQLRWLNAADLPAVFRIAADSFPRPWLVTDFREALTGGSVIAKVAVLGDRVVGYVVYDVHMGGFTLLNAAVTPAARRTGVGRALVASLVASLEPGCTLTAIVNERELPAQLWLKALGFQAIQVLRGHFPQPGDGLLDDGYHFTLAIGQGRPAALL